MATLLALYQNQFLVFVLILTRISGLVASSPVLGLKSAPMQVRAFLAVALAIVVTPFHWQVTATMPANMPALAILLVQELMLGLSLGLSIHVLFSGLHVTGQVMGQLSGMSLAEVFDPSQEASVPVLADLMDRVTVAVFVIIGGHRQLMIVLLDTFKWMPPGKTAFGPTLVDALTEVTTQSLTLGVRASAPAIVALLMANLILGLISRTLPQLNVMALGFGINILLVLLVMCGSLGAIAWLFQDSAWETIETMREAFAGLVNGEAL
ncbi:MAG TPA: flagellar biosynthetic protein FliR, partial [Pirellulaceae bacterium]|nr:flagellar biosynthetic protein FliR [Pirellulaceae bacterium]